mgnify:CR=1 FL=1
MRPGFDRRVTGDPAPAGARAAAAVVDMLPVLVLLAGAWVIGLATPWPWWVAWVPAAGAAAWLGLLWWMAAADGRTPGKRWRHLAEVAERTGTVAAPGRVLARLALRGALVLVTMGIAGLSFRWDPAGRERTWWDRVVGTVVVPGGRATPSDDAADRWAPPEPPPTAAGGGWVPGPGRGVVPAQPVPTPSGRVPVPTPPPGPVSVPRPPGSRQGPLPVRDDPSSAAGFLAPPLIGGAHRPVPPASPGGLASPGASAQPGTGVALVWDTGRRILVTGRVVIGRDPVPGDGEHVDQLLPVTTDSVGVSKTHLQIDVGPTGILVTDRRSTNGVRIAHADGSAERCPPGVPVPVVAGDAVHFGGRFVTVDG